MSAGRSLLIKDLDLIATLDDQDRTLASASLYIEDGRIAALGADAPADADRVISGAGKIALPGFVNTHHHLYQTLTRAIPRYQDAALFEWLQGHYEIWREITPEAVYTSALVGLGELLLTGCTTTTDMFYLFPRDLPPDLIDQEIRAARTLGIRFQPCRGSMSLGRSKGGLPPDDCVQTEEEILADCERLLDQYHDPGALSMTRIALGPCSPFSVTPELMKHTVALARRHENVRCHTHLAETLDEERYCLKTAGMRPYAYMESLGWTGEDIWFAHCVHVNDQEITRMAKAGVGVAHCPVSNLRLSSGIAPLQKFLKAGVAVGLGVDGSASNDSSDMLGELRTCMLVHRAFPGSAPLSARQVLRLATRGGARVLGWPDIGSLQVGKAADLILVNLHTLGLAGACHDPVAALLFAGDSHIVDTTIVNGEVVVSGGKLVKVNEEALVEEANYIAARMVQRASARTGINYLAQPDEPAPEPAAADPPSGTPQYLDSTLAAGVRRSAERGD